MRIAFTTSGDGLEGAVDDRFGRAARFLIYDLESETFEIVDNSRNRDAPQGAGVQSAEAVARSGAIGVVTGRCGPKALRVLTSAGIKVYSTTASTVSAALQQYRAGRLEEVCRASLQGR